MLESIQEVLAALWRQDFNALLAPGSAVFIYLIIVTFIGLESAFLPAAPLPCDSVVVLAGSLAAVGVLNPLAVVTLLIAAASVGSWLAFLQGRWLNRLPRVNRWLSRVPPHTMKTVDRLLCRHGVIALFCARFVPGARSITPMMMGARVNNVTRFHYFSWFSATLWVCLLVGIGFLLPSLPEPLSRTATSGLMLAPIVSLLLPILVLLKLRLKKQPSSAPITSGEI
ncbi:DedA family protein [Enterovibrio sp. ZSDZ35]|uniref:DedA family protein n=1 Tax=Enterovibrio qingdaonensis TaxID=2899818 RepID=A0ABT5QGP9_9GAMM|nr:DedA family protein [Enterovibrio sp. ZSDZ35]MDD1780152.1 DedA family protein [Enterovibrio sp. ZSDZ35]